MGRLGWQQATTFAAGDFACNLYWQSVTLYLLFYYTDALGLPVAVAGLIYMVASIWAGIADLVVGIAADHPALRQVGFRRWVIVGAVPLGLAFAALYFPPPLDGAWLAAAVLVTHLLFRTLYAVVNVPYAALTARITRDSRDRSLIAGLRMMFGAAAAVIVAFGTQGIAEAASGDADGAPGFFVAAMLFAAVATAILLAMATRLREAVPPAPDARLSLRAAMRGLAGNRAFVTLAVAMGAQVLCATVLGKSVLYYFKYYLAAEEAGRTALAAMGIAGAVTLPGWMMLARLVGTRALWIVACGLGIAALSVFAAVDIRGTGAMQAWLGVMQAALVGLNFAFWAMLPDTVEYGERATGLRVEAVTFGTAALLQKVALGLSAGLFGLIFGAIGYVANVEQAPATLAGMRRTMVLLPTVALLVSAAAMACNPLRRCAHARIVAELGEKASGG